MKEIDKCNDRNPGGGGGKSFKEYHMAYPKADLLIEADIFQMFRETRTEYYELER